jgi:hypothetical protein
MVRLSLPPPRGPVAPRFYRMPADTTLYRIFDPTRHGATALSFRSYGPLLRFDHHRGAPDPGDPSLDAPGDPLRPRPAVDPARGIYYAGCTISACVVEVYGDTRLIVPGDRMLAAPRTTRILTLLDLRGPAAMRAGTVTALAKVLDYGLTWAWARCFYERIDLYGSVDGLLYGGAHNDEEALALFERAADALICPPERIIRLDAPELDRLLHQIARDNNLVLLRP